MASRRIMISHRSTRASGAVSWYRMSGKLATFTSLILLSACGAGYPPPDGFVDACYGGDFRTRLVDGGTLQFKMIIPATEGQWPELAAKLGEVAKANDLQVFDTSIARSGIRTFEVSLCTPKGLWVYADKRIWTEGTPDRDPAHVPITLTQYEATYEWKPVAAALLNEFKEWPGGIRSEYPARTVGGG